MSQGLELPLGYYVRYVHYRFYVDKDGEPIILAPYRRGRTRWHRPPSPRGGATIATIHSANGDVVATNRVECLLSHGFRYKRGMAITKGRALKELREKRKGERGRGVLPRGKIGLPLEYANLMGTGALQ